MTSITNLSRSEAKGLRDQLTEILDNKDMNQIQIVHTKGLIHVTKSTEGYAPIKTELESNGEPLEMD